MQNQWQAPVHFLMNAGEPVNAVSSTDQAMRFLWVHKRRLNGPGYMAAARSCVNAIDGHGTHERARKDFIHALRLGGASAF